jgi:hypothetical protein
VGVRRAKGFVTAPLGKDKILGTLKGATLATLSMESNIIDLRALIKTFSLVTLSTGNIRQAPFQEPWLRLRRNTT